jgi:hypothetical protein
VTLKKIKEPNPEDIPKIKHNYEMFKVYHPNNGNARWTDKMKSYEYQQKIEKILSPNRRRFINIIGEYIMECQSLNLIAVGAGILYWKLLHVNFFP